MECDDCEEEGERRVRWSEEVLTVSGRLPLALLLVFPEECAEEDEEEDEEENGRL